MKKFKSLLMAFAGISAATLPMVAAGCHNDKPAKYVEPNNRITKGQIQVNSSIAEKVKEIKELPTVALVTESANVLDKSFNQSAWESVLTLYDQVKEAGKTMTIRPIEPDQSQSLATTYNSLLSQGIKVWILSGYKHSEELPKYINEHAQELIDKGIKIIGIDYSIDPNKDLNENGRKFKNCYCLEYNVQEPAYIVGQAVADYLKKYSPENQKTAAFGGGDYKGVTDFINGYVKGVYTFDKANSAKVSIALPSSGQINVGAGFDNNDTMRQVVLETIALKSKIILPVAGTATAVVLDELQSGNSDSLIIGVDADQSKAFPGREGKFFSSITKNIGKSVYDALLYAIFGINTANIFNETLEGIHGSFAQGWVGYAQSTISDKEQRDFVNAALAKYDAAFRSATKQTIDYVDSNATLPNTPASASVTGIAVGNTVAAEVNKLAK
ncbi:BMP family ABC transporter substrate-binding protein [Mycoplasma sp. VS292A]|uniref:BMP family ABC transporter substrate-binding protein n=1 Tax=unclassified Mycoplasma TaxID=2683645 RepID=UPI003AAC8EE9